MPRLISFFRKHSSPNLKTSYTLLNQFDKWTCPPRNQNSKRHKADNTTKSLDGNSKNCRGRIDWFDSISKSFFLQPSHIASFP